MIKQLDPGVSIERRNLVHKYHGWSTGSIREDLDKQRHPFWVLASNLYNDFNIACIIRCANAFLANQTIIYGSQKFDRRGTVGTHIYEPIVVAKRLETLDKLIDEQKLTVVAVDTGLAGATPLETFSWPERPLMAFGQEQVGLPEEILERAQKAVYVRQYGSVRSLNVAVTAGIVMQDWLVKNNG